MILCRNNKPRNITKKLLDCGLYPTVFVIWLIILPLYIWPAYKKYKYNLELIAFVSILAEISTEDIDNCLFYSEVVKD